MSIERVLSKNVTQITKSSTSRICLNSAQFGLSGCPIPSQPRNALISPNCRTSNYGHRCKALGSSASFSTSSCLFKKGGKALREEKKQASSSPKNQASSSPGGASEDPYDLTNLEADIAAAIERLKTDLSKLRAGGRFNPEVLEVLRVHPDKSSTQTVRLGDLAQVIPKGRTVQILVGEKEHIKPITTSILSSNLSLTPLPSDPTKPLLLTINIPPPTADSRRAAVAEATKAGEKAGTAIREARGKQQKKLNAMKVQKSTRPDDLKKAGEVMEKCVERGQGQVKGAVEAARGVLERGKSLKGPE